MKKLIEKARVLLEALPYIKAFWGKTVVIKYGGAAMASANLRSQFAEDVILLRFIGIKPVIVHGGGPQIGATLEKLGIPTSFVRGHRITDDATMEVVEMVLGGKINQEIVALIHKHGGRAVGLTGKDGGLFTAEKIMLTVPAGEGRPAETVDPGRVGRVVKVDPEVILRLDEGNFIPVIAPVGADGEGNAYNVNADTVAGRLAAALPAEKLILMTDVAGILDEAGKLISSLDRRAAARLMEGTAIAGGMIPKLEAALAALDGGVPKVHIIDGRIEHSVLLEVFTACGIGTEIVQ
jgi:acetylglutamate kinase